MKLLKYFFQFLLVIISFGLFKILCPNISSNIGGIIFEKVGPLFRSKKIIHSNIKKAIPDINSDNLDNITKLMWNNYGRVFAEYVFIKNFRTGKLASQIEIDGQEILNEIKKHNKQVIFVSGHLSNFELMAMHLDRTGIKLSAIYRPLNNIFLNPIMERIRKKYICKNQIKKGRSGVKEAIKFINNQHSIALMLDQRVSEGEKIKFFNENALTTTLPAQLALKHNLNIVPIFIERKNTNFFKMKIYEPIKPSNFKDKFEISEKLKQIIENMIIKIPYQWIWTHNRWK